jgi:hypothetical protein
MAITRIITMKNNTFNIAIIAHLLTIACCAARFILIFIYSVCAEPYKDRDGVKYEL